MTWIETVTKTQESCVLNSCCKTTQNFKLQRGARQRDAIFAYLLFLVSKAFFYLITNNKLIEGLETCDHHFQYSDSTTFW